MTNTTENSVIKKGFYNHTQSSEKIQVKQYIILRKDGKKCLLLRFFNESDLIINGITFTLTMIKSQSKGHESVKCTIKDISLRPGETYATAKGIVLSEDCVDFTVDIESFISKDYLYHEINGKLIASYDPRSTERKSSAVWDRLLVTKRKFSRNWLTAIVAIVGIIAFLIIGIREYERALNEMGFGLFS